MRMWSAFSDLAGVGGLALLLALALLLGGGFLTVGQGLLSVLFVQIVVQLLKRIVGRTRPSEEEGTRAHTALPEPYSFPSGHAASIMAVACCVSPLMGEFGWTLLVAAAVAGLSRVRMGVHYPADVVFGQLIGIGASQLARIVVTGP